MTEQVTAPVEQLIYDENNVMDETWWIFFTNLSSIVNNISLSVGALETVRITSSDSPFTIPSPSINLVCDTDGGAIVVNYPVGVNSANVRVGNAGAADNDVTLNGNGSETIQGESSQTLFDGETLDSIFQTTEFWR